MGGRNVSADVSEKATSCHIGRVALVTVRAEIHRGILPASIIVSPIMRAPPRRRRKSFRRSRGTGRTSPEEHALERCAFSDELVIECGKPVQNEEADKRGVARAFRFQSSLATTCSRTPTIRRQP